MSELPATRDDRSAEVASAPLPTTPLRAYHVSETIATSRTPSTVKPSTPPTVERGTLVSLVNVSAGYGDKMVLRDVSLDIYGGDFLCITGPNGGGKTTLVKVITGLVAPCSGRVEYSDELCSRAARKGRMDGGRPRERVSNGGWLRARVDSGDDTRYGNGTGNRLYRSGVRHIGYLPQQNHFDRSFPISVIDTVLSGLQSEKSLWRRYTRRDFDSARKILNSNDILHLEKCHIGSLSGGQLQRVMLCRALISEPRLLLLDEPTTWVDSRFGEELRILLGRLNAEGMTIVMVSHDVAAIGEMARRVVCLSGGIVDQ